MEKSNITEQRFTSKISKFKLYVIFFIPFFIILGLITNFSISLFESLFIYSVFFSVTLVLSQLRRSKINRDKEIPFPSVLDALPFSVPLHDTILGQNEAIEQSIPAVGPLSTVNIEAEPLPFIEPKSTLLEPNVIMNTESINNQQIEPKSTLLKPKKIIKTQPVYSKQIEPKKYCDSFFQYLSNSGLSVDKSNTYEIFSCIAASKLIIIRNTDGEIAERFVELFTDFVGANLYIGDCPKTNDMFHDLFLDSTKYTDCVSSASELNEKIHILAYRNIDLDQIEIRFSSLLEYSRNPLLPFEIDNHFSLKKIQMPANIWFILIAKPGEDIELSERISQSVVTIDLNASGIIPLEEVIENSLKLSTETLTNLLLSGYQKYYFDESIWKGIDQIEDFYRKHASFSFDNRLIRQLERYSSTYISFGGDLKEALDSVMYAKLLNVIAPIKAQIKVSSEEDFLILIEKWFGLEYMVKSKKVLKQIQEGFQINLS